MRQNEDSNKKSLADVFSVFIFLFLVPIILLNKRALHYLTLTLDDINNFIKWLALEVLKEATKLTFTCSKSTIETLEKGVKHVQS